MEVQIISSHRKSNTLNSEAPGDILANKFLDMLEILSEFPALGERVYLRS